METKENKNSCCTPTPMVENSCSSSSCCTPPIKEEDKAYSACGSCGVSSSNEPTASSACCSPEPITKFSIKNLVYGIIILAAIAIVISSVLQS